jgi:serine/threonine protein kinase/Tfp pilus assembly protein PilF
MQAERWQQVERLFHAALQRAPDERAALLAEAFADDEELWHEVESLLAEYARTGGVLENAATDLAADWLQEQEHPTLKRSLGHFQLLSQLGKGGMGEVYLAEDQRLHRKVALKLLPREFAGQAERLSRFKLEARAASALNHPNIVTIYEIDQADDTHFIATEYVEGQTLRALLKQGPLPLNAALDVAAQAASALAAAHAAGIIHRDIKPENLMQRPDGLVKVLDFGLAKLIRPQPAMAASTTAEVESMPGVIMGTLAYMSPEQARGLEVDARTDIFSLGAVLYELVKGQRAFRGDSQMAVLTAILEQEPEPLSDSRPTTPRELQRIVSKCLEKEREQRYGSAQELLADLKQLKRALETGTPIAIAESRAKRPKRFVSRRWPLLAALALLVVLALGYVWLLRGTRTAVAPEIKSLAVLPLENLSGDPAQEYFADGMTEALISNLSQVRALRVISRTSVMRFKGGRKSLQEIAQELVVDAVIEGTVQRDGGRVKITARLIQAADETPLRSFAYERELADVLKLQGEIARAVTDEIRIQVTEEERARLASARRVNPEAQEAYLLGRFHLRRLNEEDLKLSIGHFERAIQLEPDYAAAWAGLSAAWVFRDTWGRPPSREESEAAARKAALQAIALDANLAEANSSLANIKFLYDWDWAGAEESFRRAIALDPGSVEAHRLFANLLMVLERHAEAISAIQTAARLDPLSSTVQSDYGRVLFRAHKYEEAEPHFKQAIALDPQSHGVYSRLGDLYLEMGRYDEAVESYRKRHALLGGSFDRFYTFFRAKASARMGRRDEALRILNELQRTTEPARSLDRNAAEVWAALGDKDEAFRLLFKAVEERRIGVFFKGPWFDSLHSDPRWKAMLRRMNFPIE